MAAIQSKMIDWPEYNAKQALRESTHVWSKTDPKIVENFIDSYEKITKLWEQMERQFLVDSAYMLSSNGTFVRKKVPPDTENAENSRYMEEVKSTNRKLLTAYRAFIDNEGIKEST